MTPVHAPIRSTVLEELARLADGTPADSLPAEVVREASRRLLDALGCMLGGAKSTSAQAAYRAVAAPAGEATLVAGPLRSTISGAAMANATALRSLDFMDGHPGPYSCHPSLLIPALLAAAEASDASGRDLAWAIVLGYEIDARLQLGSGDPDITVHGWSGSTNLGLATSIAVGSLMGLQGEQLVNAMAIATVHAPTLDASGHGQMAPSKAAVDGIVAMSAVVAAQLAAAGMGGPPAAYDGDGGFLATVARRFTPEILLAPFDRFRILDCYTKVYNAVKCAQSAAAAAISLRAWLPSLDEIESVTLHLAERDCRNQLRDAADRRRPSNRDTANHSVVYCVAAALLEGDLQAAQFAECCLTDGRILALIDKTSIAADARLTEHWPGANPTTVQIRLRSGETRSATVLYPPGHPRNPITDSLLEAKVRTLAVSTSDQMAALIDIALRLETLQSVRPMMALLSDIVRAQSERGGQR
jgi:2-methylcitrate dehydratase